MMNKELPKRKIIRLKDYGYSCPGAYFITVCTDGRKNYFWNVCEEPVKVNWVSVGANCVRPQNLPLNDVGQTVAEELEKWHTTYDDVYLHSYVIMPNHLHIMIAILADEYGRSQVAPTVGRMVKQFKGAVSKKVGYPIWQKSFHDHIIRDRDDYDARTKYILENPIGWREDELYAE